MNTEKLYSFVSAMNRKSASMPERIRPWTSEYKEIPRALILSGLRGVGKSTFLFHHAKNKKILYFSADNPLTSDENLYEMCSFIFMQGFEGVIIDEVHFAKDWSKCLKALYDDFPDKIIWTSDSSSIVLREANADLSRRFVRIKMPLMSFREFIFLETGTVFSKWIFGSDKLPCKPDSKTLSLFTEYRAHGTRPFYTEGNYEDKVLSLLDKTLYSDVPFFLPQITDSNLRLMKAVVATLANSNIPRIEVRKLCSNWAIGSEKLYSLLNVMESVGVFKIIRFENEKKANTVGAKFFFADPCMYRILSGNEGTEREAFSVMCFNMAGCSAEASRDETKGDFLISFPKEKNKITVEVGGKNKKEKNADYVLRDNTDYPTLNGIPFWLLAMMW